MELLFSNYSPLKTGFKTYPETFKKLLKESDSVQIATGFISVDSIIDLNRIILANDNLKLKLCVGMHYFNGISPIQLQTLEELDSNLRNKQLGGVHIVTTFPYHGKLVSFAKNESITGSLLGSSNLSNIIDGSRQYESDVLIDDSSVNSELQNFISGLITEASKPLTESGIEPTIPENDLLNEQVDVEKVLPAQIIKIKSNFEPIYSFEIPLKGDVANKSGLNTYLGEGRQNVKGIKLPRSWYEVELIVPKSITTQKGYPVASKNDDTGVINVITDDGWSFKCKVSGDHSKNFRSSSDLKTLGKWLKGRLVNAGALKPGERVTDQTFVDYGRNNISLSKIEENAWYLDFSV